MICNYLHINKKMIYNKKKQITRRIMRSSVKKRLYFERKNQSSSKNLLHRLLTAAKKYKGTIHLLLNKTQKLVP